MLKKVGSGAFVMFNAIVVNAFVPLLFAFVWHLRCKSRWIAYVGGALSPLLLYVFIGGQIGHPLSWKDFREIAEWLLPISTAISVFVGLGFHFVRTKRNDARLR